jgi:hypothetical protein
LLQGISASSTLKEVKLEQTPEIIQMEAGAKPHSTKPPFTKKRRLLGALCFRTNLHKNSYGLAQSHALGSRLGVPAEYNKICLTNETDIGILLHHETKIDIAGRTQVQ